MMTLSAKRAKAWQAAKARLILPIIYVRGFAMLGSEIEETSADPFNGFNVGSTLLRTGWTGDSIRHVFESPVLRLSQPPYSYRVAFSDGVRGLDAETKENLADWRRELGGDAAAADALPPATAVLAIYRYYDAASQAFGDGKRPGMETYGWGLGRLILDVLDATGAPGVYLVAHSMGGLVARTFLQNKEVLEGRSPAVAALVQHEARLRIAQPDWDRARDAVRRFFTYGTPHNGISAQGGIGNGVLGPLDSLLGLELANFDRKRMLDYLASPPAANSLAGKFPIESTFCLVGTAASDYPAAGGFSRRLIGQTSDGLVELDNAVVHGPAAGADPNDETATVLAARAYVRRAHSGPYGMVNSEEGFGNLSRFLFGDLRVEGDLQVRGIDLPPPLQRLQDAAGPGGDAGIRASYGFEVYLRVRGARWALTERLAQDGAAIFRRYDELFPDRPVSAGLGVTPRLELDRQRHARISLFSAFLDTGFRTLDGEPDMVEGRPLRGTLGFALRLRAAVPDYEVKGSFWRTSHYEGSALFDRDLVFLAYEDAQVPGGWGLAWGPNTADGDNSRLKRVTGRIDAEPDDATPFDAAFLRALPDAVEFWIPLAEDGPPKFRAWLRLTARRWNA